ncbi:MAG: HAD-IC family P-type ATPase [Thermoplasmatales archaeon]|nr:MAG: HAD-IC family P-type ATPase [Thermoplasmatales archaeon]
MATIAGLVTLLLFKFYLPYAPYLYAPAAVIAAANVFVIGHNVLRMAGSSLRRGILNQHVLMELAALAAFSAGIMGPFTGFSSVPFFSIATFITTYHLLGAYLTTITRERSTKAIFKLLSLSPEKAHVITDQGEQEIPTKEVRVGDIVLVKPGESVPVDGEVVEGTSEIDESMVTGESMPVGKSTGSSVIGGSSNINGVLTVRAKVVGEDSFLSKVAGQIEEARVMKPGIMQLIDVILKYFAPAVILASVLGFVIWLLIPYFLYGVITFTLAVYAAISALVMGYPCALGMSTPLALERGRLWHLKMVSSSDQLTRS